MVLVRNVRGYEVKSNTIRPIYQRAKAMKLAATRPSTAATFRVLIPSEMSEVGEPEVEEVDAV